MPISVDPVTHIIDIPQNYCTQVVGTLWKMDTNQFRKDLSLWAATEEGRTEPFPYSHNTEYNIVGSTYARKVEILAPYKIRCENTGSMWSIRFESSNNNCWDLENGIFIPNNVIPIANNSAGLQTVNTGGTTPALDASQIAQLAKVDEVHTRLGMNAAIPVTNNIDGSFNAQGIDVDALVDGSGNITHQRQ